MSTAPTHDQLGTSFTQVDTELRDPDMRALGEEVLKIMKAAVYRVALGFTTPQADQPLDAVMRERLGSAPVAVKSRAVRALRSRLANEALRVADLGALTETDLRAPTVFDVPLAGREARLGVARLRRDFAREGRLGALRVVPLAEDEGGALRPQSEYRHSHVSFKVKKVHCVDEQGWDWVWHDHIEMGGVAVDETGDVTKIRRKKISGNFDTGETVTFSPEAWNVQTFDVREGGDAWPKVYTVKLVMVERDWGDFPGWLEKLYGKAKDALADYVGSFWAALKYVVSWVLDKLLGWIKDLWEDDLIDTVTYRFTHAGPRAMFEHGVNSGLSMVRYYGNGAKYKVHHYWRLENPGAPRG